MQIILLSINFIICHYTNCKKSKIRTKDTKKRK